MRLVLASASPRRAGLLRAAGIEFDVQAASADETVRPGETPEAYVRRVADAKARAVAHLAAGRLVLAADTTVVVAGSVLGKPVDDEDAKRMLRMLSGRAHEVVTAVSLLRAAEGPSTRIDTSAWHVDTRVESTTVAFAPLTEDEISWYVSTGEPRDKAGAYAIQGYASRFITRINGSYSNVVGLPVALVYEMLTALGPTTPGTSRAT